MAPVTSTEEFSADAPRLCARPAQLLISEGDIILVRGRKEIHIGGKEAGSLVAQVLGLASGPGATRASLLAQFSTPQQPVVSRLIDDLMVESILVPAGEAKPLPELETATDIFYWHFGQTTSSSIEKMVRQRIVLLGVNTLSRRIALSLRSLGMSRLEVVDFHILRNQRMHDASGNVLPEEWPIEPPIAYDTWADSVGDNPPGCIVASSDFGGPHLLRDWNQFCVENQIEFLPVVLDRFVGTLGPFVIPNETACYECLRLRENSNLDAPGIERVLEQSALDLQGVTGFHPTMTSVLGELTALELCKRYGGLPWSSNRLIEVDLLSPSVLTRRVLKLPRCPVCSPTARTAPMQPASDSFVPGNAQDP